MNEFQDIEQKIDRAHAPLAPETRARMWAGIEAAIAPKRAVVSPYVFISRITEVRALVPAALALILIVGLGGTAMASESARPGDVLFPVDRAIEQLRLRATRDEAARAALARTFTDERIREIQDLIDDSTLTDGTVRTERIDEAVAVTLSLIDEAGLGDDAIITDLANELRNANVEVRDDRIRARFEDGRFEVRHEDGDDDDSDDDRERIEYRAPDGERIRIEKKDGEVRVKTSGHVDDDFDDSSSRSGSNDFEDDSRDRSRDDSSDDRDDDSRDDSGRDSDDDSDDRDDDSSGKDSSSGSGSDHDSNDDDDDSSGSSGSGSGSGKGSGKDSNDD